MKKFEAGKSYTINGGGKITITKRTPCYITFSGDYSGRKRVGAFGEHGIFGLGEHIWIPDGFASRICVASHEA